MQSEWPWSCFRLPFILRVLQSLAVIVVHPSHCMSTAVVFGSRCHMSLHMLYQVCIEKPVSHNWIEPAKWRWQAGYTTWNECGQRARFEFLITHNHYSWPVRPPKGSRYIHSCVWVSRCVWQVHWWWTILELVYMYTCVSELQMHALPATNISGC